MILPTEKVPAAYKSPRVLVLYSQPKAGKTTVLSQLPNSLLIDFERGTDHIDAVKVTIVGLIQPNANRYAVTETEEVTAARHKRGEYYLTEVITALREGHTYKYLILDTLTSLEDLCKWDATEMYMNAPVGKKFNRWSEEEVLESGNKLVFGALKPRSQWKDVTTLGEGFGYRWLRDSYDKWIGYIKPLVPHLICTGHLKVSVMAGKKEKTDEVVEVKDLDLTGKIKSMTTQLIADATGYFYREGTKGYISFEASDTVKVGSRAAHLSDKKFLISEKLEDGTIKTYWENIFK